MQARIWTPRPKNAPLVELTESLASIGSLPVPDSLRCGPPPPPPSGSPHVGITSTLFRPSLIPDLSGWWDIDDVKTRTIIGGNLSQWDDKSGLGRNFTQGVAGDRPLFEAAGWNGRPSPLFDGVREFMIADAAAADFTGTDQPLTLIMAIEWVSHTASDRGWSLGNSGDNNPFMDFRTDGANIDVARDDDTPGGVVVAPGGTAMAGRRVYSLVFPGTTVSTYIDGAVDINAVALNLTACTFDEFTIACFRRISAASFGNIRVPEIAIWKRALSTAERTTMERYLTLKWTVS